METVRLRLVFNDRHLLSKSQKTEGLKRSWLLLKPDLETISELESHLIYTFDLKDSCPNGVLLTMDGFVLPPFESTHIFKDKDIIRVKTKGGTTCKDVIKIGNQADFLEDSEVLGKQHVLPGVELLALDEFEKESGGYQSEPEELKTDSPGTDYCMKTPSSGKTISKKRKPSVKSLSAKKRIKRSIPQKDQRVLADDVENDVNSDPEGGCHPKGVSRKTSHKKDRSSKKSGKLKKVKSTQVDCMVKNTTKSMVSEESHDQHQQNDTTNLEDSPVSKGMKKLPSRSARRKKAKRKWRSELASAQRKETVQSHLPPIPVHRKSPEPLQADEDTDKEDEIVPIVVKPGHIRFEPLDEDQVAQRCPDPVENFNWNVSTSKKRGQKWGQEKTITSRSNGYTDSRRETFEKLPIEEGKLVNNPIDFEKLKPLSGFPKEGDIVAYRLVELSSSWCPELSSFRVGKVSSCDSVSQRVVLVPVPEYPIVSDEMEDETETPQVDASLYKDDGSLEIDFAALVDIRILHHESSHSTTVITSGLSEAAVTTKEAVSGLGLNGNNGDTNARISENGGLVNVWDEISQALNKKKTELVQQDGWNKKERSGRSSWSFRAMRSSALGPTIALLRAGNDLSV